ncbi:reverse transcriptase domain-containing protein [Tanacetum coccineum]
MDIASPLLEELRKLKYLIVAIDYFTKWLEAKRLATITGKQIKNFAFDNIVCKLRVMATIIADNGTQLINESFKSWTEGLEIKVISTSVLAYGTKAVILVEIGMPSHQTTQREKEGNGVELRLNLNLLEERREIAAITEVRQKQQVEKYYNQRVHHEQFKIGGFVLQKNESV